MSKNQESSFNNLMEYVRLKVAPIWLIITIFSTVFTSIFWVGRWYEKRYPSELAIQEATKRIEKLTKEASIETKMIQLGDNLGIALKINVEALSDCDTLRYLNDITLQIKEKNKCKW